MLEKKPTARVLTSSPNHSRLYYEQAWAAISVVIVEAGKE
jgi:hypothetical protein